MWWGKETKVIRTLIYFLIFQTDNKTDTNKLRFRYSLVSLNSSLSMVNPNIINLELPFKSDEVSNEAMAKEASKYY